MFEFRQWAFCAETLDDFLSSGEMSAIAALAELCDPRRDSHFWESIVARITSGTITDHKCAWDIEIGEIRVEVKFATAFLCRFNNGARKVFKFASLTGTGKERKPCDVLVLVGFDDPFFYTWVMPYGDVKGSGATLSVPTDRKSDIGVSTRAFFDKHAGCPSQLLPDILAAAKLSDRDPDAKHHARNAALTRRRKAPQIDMEDFLNASG